jgi:hypothetical protein
MVRMPKWVRVLVGFLSAFALGGSLLIVVLYTFQDLQESRSLAVAKSNFTDFLVGYIYGLAFLVWLALVFYT